MMSHVETLAALGVIMDGASAAIRPAQDVFVAHATPRSRTRAMAAGTSCWTTHPCGRDVLHGDVHCGDGTRCRLGGLDAKIFEPVIALAWEGLSRVIHNDGYVAVSVMASSLHSEDYPTASNYNKSTREGVMNVVLMASWPKPQRTGSGLFKIHRSTHLTSLVGGRPFVEQSISKPAQYRARG